MQRNLSICMLAVLVFFPAAPSIGAAPPQAVDPEGCIRPLMDTHTVPPYPQMSVMTGEQGTTLMRVTIGADGVVKDVKVELSSGSIRLDDAAMQHLREKWRWAAPGKTCTKIPVETRVSMKWDLRDAAQDAGVSFLLMPRKDYPATSLENKEEGTAVVSVWLVPGKQPAVQVLQSSGSSALDAKSSEVLATRYGWAPATANQRIVSSVAIVAVVWKLDTK